MKKILLGLLVVGGLSACSSSEEKVNIPMQIQTLSETISTQTREYESLKAETEELKMQVQGLNSSINEIKN
ncbi:MAG: hypothetical protein WBG30_12450 [Psychrilyobacter sp.]|uniref:hypothetical protein n=1 Tax=Psychrilyobacter sp. TaxID=2586924 RepID=UPI003C78DD60